MEPAFRNIAENSIEVRLKRAMRQFVKYCLVGAIGLVVNLIVYSLLVKGAHFYYLAGATVSFIVAVTNNFILNKYWTFGNPQGGMFVQAGRFLIISGTSLFMNLLILRLLIEDLNLDNKIVAQVIAISLVTVFNFMGNKMWSFRRKAT